MGTFRCVLGTFLSGFRKEHTMFNVICIPFVLSAFSSALKTSCSRSLDSNPVPLLVRLTDPATLALFRTHSELKQFVQVRARCRPPFTPTPLFRACAPGPRDFARDSSPSRSVKSLDTRVLSFSLTNQTGGSCSPSIRPRFLLFCAQSYLSHSCTRDGPSLRPCLLRNYLICSLFVFL